MHMKGDEPQSASCVHAEPTASFCALFAVLPALSLPQPTARIALSTIAVANLEVIASSLESAGCRHSQSPSKRCATSAAASTARPAEQRRLREARKRGHSLTGFVDTALKCCTVQGRLTVLRKPASPKSSHHVRDASRHAARHTARSSGVSSTGSITRSAAPITSRPRRMPFNRAS